MTSAAVAVTVTVILGTQLPALPPPSSALAAPNRMLVMPFENVTRNSRIFWLGEASAVLLADDLNALGSDAIAREERRHAFEQLQVPPVAALTDATVIRIGQLVGASHVIVGSLELDNDTLVVRARSIALVKTPIAIERRSDARAVGTLGNYWDSSQAKNDRADD